MTENGQVLGIAKMMYYENSDSGMTVREFAEKHHFPVNTATLGKTTNKILVLQCRKIKKSEDH